MSAESLIIFLAIGAVAGWLAGLLFKGRGFGLFGDIVIGIIGAFIGSFVFGFFGIYIIGGIVGSIIKATIGAIVLLFVISFLKRI